MMMLAAVAIGGVVVGWVVAGQVRRHALHHGHLDQPNDRSSHTQPTPRGGGLGIGIAALLAIVVAAGQGVMEARMAAGLGLGVLLVGGIGWLDDHGGMSARVRAVIHLLAAALMVLATGTEPGIRGGVDALLSVLWIAWCINLYNFMDGLDGLAGIEGVMVGLAGAVLLATGGALGLATVSLAVAGACAGFLRWNWPPARIFMGDAGSGTLGFLFGALSIAGQRAGAVPAMLWVVLLGVFVVDASVTLARRVLRGEQWYAAHRTHAYQRLNQSGWSHRAVALGVATLNLVLVGMVAIAFIRPGLRQAAGLGAVVLLLAAYLMVERRRPF